jgi:hypothetical protein
MRLHALNGAADFKRDGVSYHIGFWNHDDPLGALSKQHCRDAAIRGKPTWFTGHESPSFFA